MESQSDRTVSPERPPIRSLLEPGAVALVFSILVNSLIVFVANTAGIAPELDALNYGPVTVLTTVGVVGATATYGILTRLTANPDRVFVAVATVVLLVSLIPDFTYIPDEPGGTLLAGAVLGLMHVTTAVICVVVLTRS